jgi:glycosyltransferase involved in cell wall biosynthesis|tara:strand:+ start:154 stop:837 length:684 start_codon:yes stop_codon:yes gene_type:complete
MNKIIEISVIIPIYNEESTCQEIINKVKKIDLVKEIIVVDDCSTDSTFEIINNIDDINIIKHDKNMGKGAAVRSGLSHVKYHYVITQDADLEYYPEDFNGLIETMNLNNVEVVYGSRWLEKPIVWSMHYIVNQMISLFSNVFNGILITDMPTCYKLMPTSLLRSLNIQSNGFGIDAEITAKLARNNKSIKEIPIKYSKRGKHSGKKLRLRDGLVAAWTCFRYSFIEK